ncbi:unnamed protein product [Pleuronectes platessa]|uniref:Fibronectin type-III domain-containing protein n=1 Tax=Pleuronectes platessa TaxID=8262 RepID=A0A9N7TVH5_PLEPL|nr:unnamed protein product [Pleuronectes platessa]
MRDSHRVIERQEKKETPFSFILTSGCRISSAKASGPSSIVVKWDKSDVATSYFLDLRVKNNTNFAPVVVTLSASVTEKDVQGLRPGTEYIVTLKVFQFYFVVCVNKTTAWTVPNTSQIEASRALSSSSIFVKWSVVPSADYYYLTVSSQATGQVLKLNSTNTSAVVRDLMPSTNFDCSVTTANQAGLGRTGKVKTITTLVRPPLMLTAEQTGPFTARVTWQPVKDVLVYNCILQNLDEPTSPPSVHNVTDTKLDVTGILPCSTYLITVASFNAFLVPSEPTNFTYTTNKLPPVSSISVDYTCTVQSATVHWSAVSGATSYKAAAKGDNGTELTCTSQTTSCQITGLSCGQNYVVNVMPISENCQNMMNSTSATFQTGPCPPRNLSLIRDCSSDVIVFSWERTSNTDHYLAKAVDSQGELKDCLTEDNSCYFTHMMCGRHYFFTVSSITGDCRSQISTTVDVRTAPCAPQNLQTSSDCKSDGLLSKWDLAEGALSYTLEALGNMGQDNQYNCTTTSNSCVIPGIQCGQYLTIYITAFNDECSSGRTLGPVAETVPCTPNNVTAVKECGADSINTTWAMAGGAIFYVAIAEDSDGVTHHCNAINLMCTINDLKCSTNYTVHVIASNFMCNSSESQTVTVETGACPLDNVTASLDCAANKALISWNSDPSLNSFTATIVDEDQGLLSCNTVTTSCWIPNLNCGKLYTVTVRYHDGICPSIPSNAIYLDSVPCGPANLQANVDCATGGLTLDWDASSNAEGYVTVISDGTNETSHDTTQPKLSVSTLECGLEYTASVTSFNGTCVSFPSVLTFREAPCVPTSVVAERNCGQTFVGVTWQASRGAKSYSVAAVYKDGNGLECLSNTTSCNLEGVMCGQVYNVSVAAVDNNCTSQGSPAVSRPTAPCPPSQLNVSLNCGSNSAALTWDSSPNAVSYTGKAVSVDGHNVTCDAGAMLSCQLEGLHCGKKYTFTVSASDGDCHSPDSEPVMSTTAPCAVQNLLNTLNCSTNILTVSWTPGSMPLNYSVTAKTSDHNVTALHCATEGSSCMLSNLECGVQYNVTVRAISSTCEGHSSVPQIVNSIPCVPASVQGVVECSTATLQASWDAVCPTCAASYISTLTDEGGFSTSCVTANGSCSFPGLQCAQTYNLSVVAFNDRCTSSTSTVVSATTAPCDPSNVTAALNCISGAVMVTWGASAGASHYTVLAEASGHLDSCTSTSTSCDLSQLRCGEDYTVTVLAGDGNCNSSILAKTNVTTAPCAPVIQNHSLDCVSNNASVTWVEDEDAVAVTVSADSSLGHSTSCSSSANSSCVLNDLRCGNTYTVQAVAQGHHCASKPSSTFEIVTAPCTPAHVEYSYSCVTGIALLSWDETLGRDRFYAHVQSGNHTASCVSTQTQCSLPSLLCGLLYDVEVIAVADHCNSSTPGVAQIQTAPCAPTNVNVSLVCDNNTAAVSWQPSPGAISYKVTAQGRDGDAKECTTNGTSCDLPHLHCAQTYLITVTPSSSRCQGFPSTPVNFIAGSCPPTSVGVSLQCVGNVGHVSWSPALGADHYEATAVDDHVHTCTSAGTNCSLTDLLCGETSVVTVVTVERGCRSQPSLPVSLQSVICPPTNVTGVTNCTNSDITVSWNPSPESGVSYILHSQEDGGVNASYTTTQTSHVISGLQCGESYNLTVAARDSDCTSDLSEPIQIDTAPCPPINLTATAECGTNSGTLTWAPSAHAISYTATATGTHGHLASCWSNSTTCSVKLDCGHQYSAFVVATSATCNSSAGESITFYSAPCLPDQVVAELDCNVNSFAVQWRGSIGDDGSYTAIAIGSDGTRAGCNSTNTNCTIENLTCGLTYSIVVTTSSVDCGTIEGSDYSVQSAACKPDNVAVNLQCGTNSASVVWGNSGPNQTEVVTAVDSRGGIQTCNSSSSVCTFDQLTCGETYIIGVVGHTNSCSSEPAAAQPLKTETVQDIELKVTRLIYFFISSSSSVCSHPTLSTSGLYHRHHRGHVGLCTRRHILHGSTLGAASATMPECTDTDTNCNFPGLACGQDYNITVVARPDSCVGSVSETITATTGPCPHTGLEATLDCNTNTATVSWTPGSGILYYNASATAFNIVHEQTCSTSGNSCNITSLRCGEGYKVSVSGQGQTCPSPGLDWQRVKTAPCPPTNLTVDSSCQSNNIVLSWQASQGSFSYMAVAEDAQGHQWSCNTSSTSCQIPSLLCGQQYQVYAVGVDANCFGAKSNIEVIRTAPCVPQNIQSSLDCRAGVLNVTWQSTGHLLQSRATVASSEGHVSTCTTDEHSCLVPNMQCDLTYNVSVMAEDEACNSSQSPVVQVLSAPCPLSSFLPTVHCGTGVVSVAWNNSVAGVEYTVSAVDKTGQTHNCTDTSSGCDLSTLECGTKYNVTITPSRNGFPCVPTLSEVEIDCLTNSTWLLYQESGGAGGYVATVADPLGDEEMFECDVISEGLCAVPQLNCSKNLTVTLRARDQQCSSAPSNAVRTETAPCTPQNVNDSLGCDNATISISWSAVPGAVAYAATLEEMNGNTTCCTTPDTSCDITDMPCGEFYFLHVRAEGRICNSSQSEAYVTRTAPCVPQNLQASLSCSDNVASVSWDYSKGGQVYQVTAVSAGGHEDQCETFMNQCELTGLLCGRLYNATVTAEDYDCRSRPSESVTIRTAPCTPANMSSVVDCEANALVVSWSESPGADSYIAKVQDRSGHATTCQATTEGHCNVTGLGCGQIYDVFVVSSDGYCNSPPTPVVDTAAVPCEPRNIQAVIDCYTETSSVTWSPSDGAQSYVVTAVCTSGHNVTCDTNTTTCDLDGLSCGQSYNVSVEAVGQTCSSIAHMLGPLVTGPCIPEHISTQYSLTIGQVLWDKSPGADNYTVAGVTLEGLMVSCSTIDTNCAFNNLNCGQLYNVSVTANNHVCQGVATSTEEVEIATEPCPPNNVGTSVDCQSGTGTVSWETSFGAVGYSAHLAGRNGDSLSCYTNETFCNIEDLHCGVIYYTNVIAVGQTLNSSLSPTVLLVAAPCAAENVKANVNCENSSAEISWSPANGASSYAVTAVAADGHRASCETTEDRCELTTLQCGQTYNVSLTTISAHCQTERPTNATFSTRPCKPSHVGVDLQCGNSTAKLFWEEREDVELYMATASCSLGTLQCNTTNSTCLFPDLQCGQTYNFSVTAYGNMCYSETSSSPEIHTEPCQPTGLTVDGSCYNDTLVLDWSAAEEH